MFAENIFYARTHFLQENISQSNVVIVVVIDAGVAAN